MIGEGQRIGCFTVKQFVRNINRVKIWLCKCDCGAEVERRADSLRGNNFGCPKCFKLKQALNSIKHGDWQKGKAERLYTVWQSMKARCTYNKHPRYKYYGGKGITICEEWLNYPEFKMWATNNGYADNLTIDRINSDLGYSPSNCQFITKSENSRKAISKSHETIRRRKLHA
jgi:hypothetical protein